MLKQCSSNAHASNEQCPSPFLSSPEEQRQTSSLHSEVSPEPQADSGAAPDPLPEVLQTFIRLPLNTGAEHPVTHGEAEQWQDLYPAVDVKQELRNMRGWLLARPKRRKTQRGIGKFIQHWLGQEQDKGGKPNARASPRDEKTANADAMAKINLEAREKLYGDNAGDNGTAFSPGSRIPPGLDAGSVQSACG